MKCPLKREVLKDNFGNLYDNSLDCLKKKCAWWDSTMHQCVKLSELEALTDIQYSLRGILRKISLKEQIRK